MPVAIVINTKEYYQMAVQEQLERLIHSINEWNQWRIQQPEICPDLSGAYLSGANLSKANLSKANLSGADLSGADLTEACLSGADLFRAYLSRANLSGANLSGANLTEAYLTEADLSGADLTEAYLTEAYLFGAYLIDTNLSRAYLSQTNLSHSYMSRTFLGELDLRSVKGLETVIHKGPSHLSINTLYLSHCNIPEIFVRGTGAPDSFIEYMSLLATRPPEYYICFISYASKDQPFAEQLYADLQHHGVCCWLVSEDLQIAEKFRQRIDASIRHYDKLLLVLSRHSVASPWVEKEVKTALDKEKKTKRPVLFPIKLDNTATETDKEWVAAIQYTRHIGDFTRWKALDEYQKALNRLLRNLKVQA
jgi:hypothetical protein